MGKLSFQKATHDMKPDDPRYKEIQRQFEAEETRQRNQHARQHKMKLRILDLAKPLKQLNYTKLDELTEQDLLNVGKAARALFDALDSAGLIDKSYVRNDKDFS